MLRGNYIQRVYQLRAQCYDRKASGYKAISKALIHSVLWDPSIYNHHYLLKPILSSISWDRDRYNNRNDGDKLSGIVYPTILLALYFTYIATLTNEALIVHSDGSNDNDDNSNQSIEATIYRRHEVALHNSIDRGVWVIYDDGVYDITKFIPNHPGGQEKVLLAAGDDIAPYWKLYQQHFNSSLPMELLESMRIGSLHPDDVKAIEDAKIASEHNNDDPYANDPSLSKLLTYHGRSPTNAESSPFLATDYWVTPIDLWFARNHHPIVVHLNENNYRLEVGWDAKILPSMHINTSGQASDDTKKPSCSISLSLNELKTQFQPHTIISTLQCGGNRRAEMNEVAATSGIGWCNAISTAQWRGARLRDVLIAAGVDEDSVYNTTNTNTDIDAVSDGSKRVRHVHFIGADGMQASIPIKKALSRDGDVLLAYEMNESPVPSQHGAPIRVIVPGHVGVRNVKWVTSIRVSDEEATGPWQRGMAYKGFSPSLKSLEGIDVEKIPSLQEQPVQSVITTPAAPTAYPSVSADSGSSGGGGGGGGSRSRSIVVSPGRPLTVKGYSYSGGGRGIVRVDVSIDGGKNWKTASLREGSTQPLDRSWAWTFWDCDFDIPVDNAGKTLEVICKATDASYNVQPDSVAGIWNLRGINNNAWHRVSVHVVEEQEGQG